jgi:Uma2 family endonuclease
MRFSADNPGWHIEREPDGSLNVNPSSYVSAIRAAQAAWQLFTWGGDQGFVATAGGVTLPDKAVRAPDASWISFKRWHRLNGTERENYPNVVPDVVIEIVSEYDSYAAQRRKTEHYVKQGATYGVVIDPERCKVEEFGTPPDGLVLDFDRIIGAG